MTEFAEVHDLHGPGEVTENVAFAVRGMTVSYGDKPVVFSADVTVPTGTARLLQHAPAAEWRLEDGPAATEPPMPYRSTRCLLVVCCLLHCDVRRNV